MLETIVIQIMDFIDKIKAEIKKYQYFEGYFNNSFETTTNVLLIFN